MKWLKTSWTHSMYKDEQDFLDIRYAAFSGKHKYINGVNTVEGLDVAKNPSAGNLQSANFKLKELPHGTYIKW